MDLYHELQKLLERLQNAKLPYALCGGLAVAVYGIVRATEDIDVLVQEQSLPNLRTVTDALGFRWNPTPFTFKEGGVKIYRLFKPLGDEVLVLDVMLVTPLTELAWNSRREIETDFGPVQVVSPAGLIHLKSLRGSGQDEDDIARLKELNEA